jgi:uncharacterized membrane protein
MGTESPSPRPTSRLVPAIVTACAVLWTVGAVVAPWLAAQGSFFAPWLRLLYKPGCHQIAERCLDLGFGLLAVCARCMGLYVGGCLGLLWTTLRNRSSRPQPVWLAVVAAPTVLDFAAGQIGLPSLSNWPRFALAVPLGLLAGLYLGDALLEIVRQNSHPTASANPARNSVG